MKVLQKRSAFILGPITGSDSGLGRLWRVLLVTALAMVITSTSGLALDEGGSDKSNSGKSTAGKSTAANDLPAKPLAVPHYLDERQASLAKQSGKWEDYVRFAGKVDSLRDQGNSGFGPSYQDWKENDEQSIRRILSRLWQTAPGLLIASARGGKIVFSRVSTLAFSPTETHVTAKDSSRGYAAVTAPGGILIADRFFIYPGTYQYHGVVHELIHGAEYSCRVCFSKEWIDFALPKIQNMRNRFFKGGSYDYYAVTRSIKKEKLWPSIYGCENLREGLAEYLAAYVEGTDFPVDSYFITQIAPHILAPTEREQNIEEHFLKGRLAYQAHDQERAFAEFSATQELAPEVAEPYTYLSYCSGVKHDYLHSVELGKKAQSSFEAAGVPIDEPRMMSQTRYLMDCEGYLHEYEQQKKLLDRILASLPDNRDALYKRYWYYRREGQYAAAAQDFYASVCGPHRIEEDELDMVGGAKPESAVTWFELQRNAETNLKWKDYAKAQKYCDEAIALNADAIEPYITRIRLQEAIGNKEEAKTEFFELEKKIAARDTEPGARNSMYLLPTTRMGLPRTVPEGAKAVEEFLHGNKQVLYGF